MGFLKTVSFQMLYTIQYIFEKSSYAFSLWLIALSISIESFLVNPLGFTGF